MQEAIAGAARQDRVALFPRFDLMQRAVQAGLPIGALVSWDGLHLSADGYDCIGRAVARAIVASPQAK
jgi:lysophospholipase L1-like esterase